MVGITKYKKETNSERMLSSFVPFSSHIDDETILTADGDLIRVWKLHGVCHETADPESIQLWMDQLNTLYRSFGVFDVAIWTHNIRRKVSDKLNGVYENEFCKKLDEKYYNSFKNYRMMASELYVSLIYRPRPSKLQRAFLKSTRRSLAEIKADLDESIRKLSELTYQFESSMKVYRPDLLTTYNVDGVTYSKPLELYNYLLSGVWQKVRVPRIPLNQYLGTSWVYAGIETIEIRSPVDTRYAQAIDFKDYTDYTEPGFLNALMYEDYEYVFTQSFSFLRKHEGKKFLERQKAQLRNTEDGSLTQIEELEVAIDQLISGQFCMGEYHASLLIFGETVDTVRRNVASAMAIIMDRGLLAAIVNTATDAAFYAQLPCNWFYRPRVAVITSKNFAGLSSFHNFASGKRDGNPWGEAVTFFKTPSGQPFYFNFHSSRDDDDVYGKKLLGNTRLIGQSGTGKTVLICFLLAQAQKYRHRYRFTNVFFDKDRGAELLIRAIGGKYLNLKNGVPTGFNPFQIEVNEKNILFLESLVRFLAASNGPITTVDETRISQAVRTVMRMPIQLRRLTTVTQNMTEGTSREERENSVVKRLRKWCEGGPLAWVLDNPVDQLDFTSHDVYGFDGTDFLDNAVVRDPITMYLLHRMDSIIDGRRFIYWMDEFWKWVENEVMADFSGDQQLTIRKNNGLGVFATQMPSSLLKTKIASQLVQQVATEIYLPNPKADKDEYIKGFKLSEAEFEIVSQLPEDSRMFLVKQGHHSGLARLDLAGFDDELAILSGSADNVELLDSIISEVGEETSKWIPIFHERRKLGKRS